MTLVKYKPTTSPFNSLFEDFFGKSDLLDTDFNKWTVPSVNVKEDEKQYTIEVAAPGMSKDDFNVEVEDNRLVISSEKEDETNEEKENYTRKEFSYSKFQRMFTLPKNINDKKISGKYENGILTVEIPKIDKNTLSKKVKIS